MFRLMTLSLLGLAGQPEVLAGELPRRLDRLGAPAGEEDAVELAGVSSADLVGQLDRGRMGIAPYGEVGKGGGLTGRGVGQLGATVADLAGEQAGQPVEVTLPVLIVDPRALTADDDRDLVVVARRHPGEVHPQVASCVLLQLLAGQSGHRVPHV